MVTFNKARCRTCGRAIIWAVTENGSAIPIDARPATVYTLAATDGAYGAAAVKLDVDFATNETGDRGAFYVSHFLTCPSASEHSGSNRRPNV